MISVAGAFLLRFDGDIPHSIPAELVRVFPVIVALKVTMLFVTGTYDGMWKYVGVRDLIRLGRGAVYGSIATIVLVSLWLHFGALSRGALIIDGLLFATLVCFSRLSFRMLRVLLTGTTDQSVRRVLLWGAGDVGEIMVRQLLESPQAGRVPIGFVDDDAMKIGRTIHGLRVLGTSEQLEQLCSSHNVDEILITSPRIQGERLSRAVQRVGDSKLRRLRPLFEETGA